MVVDDSQTVRNIMALIVHRLGHQIVRTRSALEALSTLNEIVPDLIFLDITLPGMDGLDICKVIKGHKRVQHVPVIILSGSGQAFDKVMGRLAGAQIISPNHLSQRQSASASKPTAGQVTTHGRAYGRSLSR